MSIASKLSYLNETKELLRNKINDLGGNIDEETPFRNYVNSLTDIYNNYPKVEGEGTNITLENTNEGKIQTILKGQNYQITSENEPSPDYPQAIESVQGLQNIIISNENSENEQNYNVDLDNIQINENEYIFKNEITSEHYDSNLDLDAYYYYKLKNKIIFDGTENWKFGTGNVFYVDNVTDYATSNNIPMSNYFKGITNVTGAGDNGFTTNDNVIAFINISGETTPRFYICSSKFNSNVNTLKTWLTTHNIEVLYNQNAGEYIKITNENLIDDLNNLETAKSYDDTTLISTNGNIPVILNVKALMKGV